MTYQILLVNVAPPNSKSVQSLIVTMAARDIRTGVAFFGGLEMPSLQRCELQISLLMLIADADAQTMMKANSSILRGLTFLRNPSMRQIDIVLRVDVIIRNQAQYRQLRASVDAVRVPWTGPNCKTYGWEEIKHGYLVKRNNLPVILLEEVEM
jgi:hypothetical protein